jgi:hypothetical protein
MPKWDKSIMFFAQDAQTKTLRHVREVPTGNKCGCICCGCGEPVEAVNAQAETFKNRPHFRHVTQSTNADCQSRSVDLAINEALIKAIADLHSVLLPNPAMFGHEAALSENEISSFELVDTCEGLLCLPDGRELRVQISTHVIGGSNHDERFDMTLTVPPEIIEEGWNVENLRQYLTTDPTCWRWCVRQTSPSIFHPSVENTERQPRRIELDNIPVHEMGKIKDENYFIPHNVWAQETRKRPDTDLRKKPHSIVVPMPDGSKKVLHRWTCSDGSMGEEMEIIPPEATNEHKGSV